MQQQLLLLQLNRAFFLVSNPQFLSSPPPLCLQKKEETHFTNSLISTHQILISPANEMK
jgi:hypothetical protein